MESQKYRKVDLELRDSSLVIDTDPTLKIFTI